MIGRSCSWYGVCRSMMIRLSGTYSTSLYGPVPLLTADSLPSFFSTISRSTMAIGRRSEMAFRNGA